MIKFKKGVYCSDCKYRWHSFLNYENGQCSHPRHLKCQDWDYRQKKKERYPFCTHVNTSGNCQEFERKWYK